MSDCEALLASRDALGGEGTLNWDPGTWIRYWRGVSSAGGRVARLDLEWAEWHGWPALRGHIPAELGDLSDLRELRLNDNQLTGPIPASLGSLRRLEVLNLSDNRLTGAIPPSLVSLRDLEVLDLSNNALTESIPERIGGLGKLRQLRLQDNRLSGAIPEGIGYVRDLEILRLDDNELSGDIPGRLGDLRKLWSLQLGGNQLTGEVPAALGDLRQLRYLWLNDNQFSGPIPKQLECTYRKFGCSVVGRQSANRPAFPLGTRRLCPPSGICGWGGTPASRAASRRGSGMWTTTTSLGLACRTARRPRCARTAWLWPAR